MNRTKQKSRGGLAPVAKLFPPQGQWSESEYFALPDTNRYVELSEGRLIMPPHPTFRHQEALKRVFLRLQAFVENNHLGMVEIAPLPVRLWAGKIREPDIFFIAQEHADRIAEQFCGVPDLVVEVISSSTRTVDRADKFYEYARAGVLEYWMVDLGEATVEVYVLKEGAYLLLGKYLPGQTATSQLLSGFQVIVDEVVSPAS